MNKVEKIKAEIERRKNQFVSQAESFHKIGKEDKESYYAALASNMNSLSCFLDSLEEEPVSNDLEEESKKYSSCIYLEEVLSDGDKEVLKERLINTFKAGAQWQKKQIIKKSCEWLSNISIEDMTYKYNDFDTSEDWYKFIEDFKKVMEE